MKQRYSRRSLFQKLFNGQPPIPKDSLFEKYKRKQYGLRRYAPPTPNTTELRIGNITSGLTPYTGVWTSTEALHLLRRSQFGFQKPDVDTFVSLGMNAAVDLLLNVDNTPPAPPLNYYQNQFPDEGSVPYGGDWSQNAFNSNSVGNTTNNYRQNGLVSWNLGLGLNQDLSLKEKMTWFWYHFIPIDFNTIRVFQSAYCGSNSARICYDYINHFRNNSTGNFKTLIRNVATQPAMMYYLNNQSNTNTAPDENFARELMELFTLGKDPLSQYTQQDVVAAARVLTGWRVQNLNTYPTSASFVSAYHDTGSKTFSSFFGDTVIANSGATELDTFIDMIFSKAQVVSEYICRRLYRYFVYYDIDANIEANVITPLAQQLVAHNWEIEPVLAILFKSEHFYDAANFGVYIKSPFDLIIGALRTFTINTNVSDSTNYQAQYYLWSAIASNYLAPIDQVMGSIPNVSGWPAYYQNPNFHEYWINSNTIQKRASFLDAIFNGFNLTSNGLTTHIEVDVIGWVQQFDDAVISDPNSLTTTCISYLLPVDLSDTAKDNLKTQNLLSNQINDSYWTIAWSAYLSNPSTSNTNVVKQRLKSLLLAIVQLAEYQLM